jgi:hypothetical protein
MFFVKSTIPAWFSLFCFARCSSVDAIDWVVLAISSCLALIAWASFSARFSRVSISASSSRIFAS